MTKFHRNQTITTQASDRHTTQVHARHTMLSRGRQSAGEKSLQDTEVQTQLFTVLFSPALSKAKLPFLLVLFQQVSQCDPFGLNTSNFIMLQQRAAGATQMGPRTHEAPTSAGSTTQNPKLSYTEIDGSGYDP